jgi:uncharacterized protein involved in exopolysaccharide biosynthesis
MIAHRELGLEDYLAIGRRRLGAVLIWGFVACVVGFLVSFALTPKYTSRSLLLVEGQIVPEGYVKPIVTERVSDRMATLTQNVLTRTRLVPLVNRLGLARKGKSVDEVVEAIRDNVTVTQADPNASPDAANGSSSASGSASSGAPNQGALPTKRKARPGETDTDDVPGFYVSYTANNSRDAQQVCAEIASMLLQENLELREQVAHDTTDFLTRQLDQAKRNLDEMDNRLSDFKKEHMGRLPTDDDKNLKILAAVNSQLDANTQGLTRAQQDKSFAESLLAEQTAAWNSLHASPNLPSLRDELVTLQNQLVILQARYTDDYPDVVKTKNDIAKVKAKIAEAATGMPAAASGASDAKLEPGEILRLRQVIHQDDTAISQASREQKRLRELSDTYQSRLAVSPDIEDQYKQLTRDNETAHKIYDDLLSNKNAADVQAEMERAQQGEQMKLLEPASLPGSPSFPVRWMFAAGGLGAGLAIGLAVAFWLELRDKSLCSEADVVAALELPMLVFLPDVASSANSNETGAWGRRGAFGKKKTVA